MQIGHCPHGEFDILKGCPRCITERYGGTGGAPPTLATTTGATPAITLEPAETALALRPGEDIEVRGYFEESMKLLKYAESRTIISLEDNKTATDDLSIISRLKKLMEAKKREYLYPLKVQTEAIRDTYNYLMAPVFEAEKITKNKMLAYDAEQRRIAVEQEAINQKLQEAAEAQKRLTGEIIETELVEVIPEAPKRIYTDMGMAGQRDNWKWRVVDEAAIPREYLVVDNAQLTAIARRHHDQKRVAGIEFYCEQIIAVRAK